jgi:hypothetical protein
LQLTHRYTCCLISSECRTTSCPSFPSQFVVRSTPCMYGGIAACLVSSTHMNCEPSYVLRCMCQTMVGSMHHCYSVAEMRERLSCGSKARANGLHMEKRRKSGKYLENHGTSGFSSNACPVPLRHSCNGKRPDTYEREWRSSKMLRCEASLCVLNSLNTLLHGAILCRRDRN